MPNMCPGLCCDDRDTPFYSHWKPTGKTVKPLRRRLYYYFHFLDEETDI